MAKLIYETTLLVCSSCVIFTGTLSAVLLMLIWPNDRILGLSTRSVIAVSDFFFSFFPKHNYTHCTILPTFYFEFEISSYSIDNYVMMMQMRIVIIIIIMALKMIMMIHLSLTFTHLSNGAEKPPHPSNKDVFEK